MDDGVTLRRAEAAKALAELIHAADPHVDGVAAASELLAQVKSPASVFESVKEDLLRYQSMTRLTAEAVDLIDDLCRYVERERFGQRPMLRTLERAGEYLNYLYIGIHVERCHLLCLNGQGRLIACPLMQQGTIDRSAVYVREIAQTALKHKARYAALSHNHPGGTPEPSAADIATTRSAMRALNVVNVVMLDHVIIADQRAVSIRAYSPAEEWLWRAQNTDDAMLRNWFKQKGA